MTEDSFLRKLRIRAPLLGDDCAVIKPRPGEDLLFTTDFSIEGVHFKRELPAAAVGRRVLARSLSDIAAMGGVPRACLVALAVAPWVTGPWLDRFYKGLLQLAQETGTQLAGGDLSHAGQLVCDVMVHGGVATGKALRRNGARAGDLVYVSGPLGGWTHKPEITPRLDIGRQLLGKATACMDITDGLALDLHRLCFESQVAAELDTIPILPGATLTQALHDGEDYELVYTAPQGAKVPGVPIGHIIEGKPGVLKLEGKRVAARGYDHFRRLQ